MGVHASAQHAESLKHNSMAIESAEVPRCSYDQATILRNAPNTPATAAEQSGRDQRQVPKSLHPLAEVAGSATRPPLSSVNPTAYESTLTLAVARWIPGPAVPPVQHCVCFQCMLCPELQPAPPPRRIRCCARRSQFGQAFFSFPLRLLPTWGCSWLTWLPWFLFLDTNTWLLVKEPYYSRAHCLVNVVREHNASRRYHFVSTWDRFLDSHVAVFGYFVCPATSNRFLSYLCPTIPTLLLARFLATAPSHSTIYRESS